MARRPTKFGFAEQIQRKCKEGLSSQYKLGALSEDVKVSLTDLIQHLRKELEDRGLDTQFRVPDDNWKKETYLLNDLSSVNTLRKKIEDWVDKLLNGIEEKGSMSL